MRNKKRSFTIVEIAIAALLLGIGLIPVFNMLSQGVISSGTTRKMVIATYLAVEMMEIIKQMDYDSIKSQPLEEIEPFTKIKVRYPIGKHTYLYNTSGETTNTDKILTYPLEYAGFKRSVMVIEPPTQQGAGDFKVVTVVVSWNKLRSNNKKQHGQKKVVLQYLAVREKI